MIRRLINTDEDFPFFSPDNLRVVVIGFASLSLRTELRLARSKGPDHIKIFWRLALPSTNTFSHESIHYQYHSCKATDLLTRMGVDTLPANGFINRLWLLRLPTLHHVHQHQIWNFLIASNGLLHQVDCEGSRKTTNSCFQDIEAGDVIENADVGSGIPATDTMVPNWCHAAWQRSSGCVSESCVLRRLQRR
jgi:hypothetical protein